MNAAVAATSSSKLPEYREGAIRNLLEDEQNLLGHLRELDIVPLLLVHTHLTGDETWLEDFAPYIRGARRWEVAEPDELCDELRRPLVRVFTEHRDDDGAQPP